MKCLLKICMVGVLIISTIFLFRCEDEMEIKGERTKTYTSTPQNQVGTDADFKALWGNSSTPLRTNQSFESINNTVAQAIESSHIGANVGGNAFDRNPLTYWAATIATFQYIGQDFGIGVAHKVLGYSVTCDTTVSAPTGWVVQGSATGVWGGEEVTVDTRAGVTWSSAGQRRDYLCSLPPVVAYRYYRVKFTTPVGVIRVRELTFGGITKYVAKNGSDLNAGTIVSPYLTIQKGVDNCGSMGAVEIIRNGYVGPMVFQENVLCPYSLSIDVEVGETATVKDNSLNTLSFQNTNVTLRLFRTFLKLSNGYIIAGADAGGVGVNSIFISTDNLTFNSGADADMNNRSVYALAQLSNGHILAGTTSAAGVSGVKISSNNGSTWVEATGTTFDNKTVRAICQLSNGRILVGADTIGIFYSTDENTFIATSLTTQTIFSIAEVDAGRVIAVTNSGVYYSDNDGANWILSNSDILIPNGNILYISNIKRILIGNYHSNDNGNTWILRTRLDLYWYYLLENGYILGSYAGTDFWLSRDGGLNWTYQNANVGLEGFCVGNNKCIYTGNTAGGILYAPLCMITTFSPADDVQISGLILDGNNNNNIYGFTGADAEFCHFKNMYQAYYQVANILECHFHNNIVENCYNGIEAFDTHIHENVIYNITNYAIRMLSTTTNIEIFHNTIYLSYIGILIEGTIATCTLENNLIHKCTGYAISSIVTQLTILNSIIYNSMFNVLSGVRTIMGILNPLFRSEDFLALTQDFRIQVVEDNYSKDSLAKNNANDNSGLPLNYVYDSGAFLITRALFSDTFGLDIIPDFDLYDLTKSFVLMNFAQKDTASGDTSKYFDGYRLELTYTQKKGTMGSDLLTSQIIRLMKSSKPMRLIPHSAGIKSGVGSFNATLLTLTLTSDTFVGRDNSTAVIDLYEGYGIKIVANANTYYFRITSHTATVITLENVEGYTGMANDVAAAYIVEFLPVKCVNPSTEFASEAAGEGWTNLGFVFNDEKRKDTGHNLKFVQTYWC